MKKFLNNRFFFFFSSRRRHTRLTCDWSSDVCSSDLQQSHVGFEPRDEGFALLPAERLTWATVSLEHAHQRIGHSRLGRARQEPAHRRPDPKRPRGGPPADRGMWVRRDVLLGYLTDYALLDTEKCADPIQRGDGIIEKLTVTQNQNPLAGERRVQVLELLAVTAEPSVMPKVSPASLDPRVFLRARLHHIADRFEACRPQVRPVGVGALDRVSQHSDELRRRDASADPSLCRAVVEVERRRLPAQHSAGCRVEQSLIVLEPPDVLAVGPGIAWAAASGRWAIGEEELRLLDRRHEERGVPG